ncbi:solute carrier family 22 member 20-like [Cynocephalus volans]|uniref:solute carrier family 22 member 20-like n=1 Tax=Cynocephalus volans TaxID=110931 RepID=UPI002FC6A976
MGFPELLNAIGGMGNFQILQTALLLFPTCLFACHNFLQNFTAMTPGHHCRPANWTNGSVTSGVSDGNLLRVFIPLDKHQKPEQCLRFSEPQWQILNLNGSSSLSLDTEACLDGWMYDQSIVASSIVTEWDLVCEHKSLKSIAQSIFMVGHLVGATTFGILSDRYGRQKILQVVALLVAAAGTSAAFAPTFPAYCVLRFLSGMALTGSILTNICLTMEWTPTQRRTLVNTYFAYMITVGQMVLSGLAFLIREWRWLQGTVSVSYMIILLYGWRLPESACWLITHNKLDAAVKNLKAVARFNGRKEQGRKLTPEVVRCHMQEKMATVKASLFLLDLFRTPELRRTTCCISVGWFSAGFSFYGLALDLQQFEFSIYWTQMLFAAIEVPANLLAALSTDYFGRRVTVVSLLLVAGCMIIANIFLPEDMKTFQLVLTLFGKGSLACCLTCLYLYTMELFPTEVRQMGMSVGVFCTRLGALLSPLVYILSGYNPVLQPMAFSLVPILAASAAYFLTETNNLPLLDTIQETEKSQLAGTKPWTRQRLRINA